MHPKKPGSPGCRIHSWLTGEGISESKVVTWLPQAGGQTNQLLIILTNLSRSKVFVSEHTFPDCLQNQVCLLFLTLFSVCLRNSWWSCCLYCLGGEHTEVLLSPANVLQVKTKQPTQPWRNVPTRYSVTEEMRVQILRL